MSKLVAKYFLALSALSLSCLALANLPPNDFSSVAACDKSVEQDVGTVGWEVMVTFL